MNLFFSPPPPPSSLFVFTFQQFNYDVSSHGSLSLFYLEYVEFLKVQINVFHQILEVFAIISSNILSTLFSLSSEIFIFHILICLMVYHRPLKLCLFLHTFCFLECIISVDLLSNLTYIFYLLRLDFILPFHSVDTVYFVSLNIFNIAV